MKVPIKLKRIIKRLKPVKKLKRAKKVKPVKKGTWKRKLKALDLRTDRRQQLRTRVAVVHDDTSRQCTNCGTQYTGRVCPQCGQPGTWSRYTWKQAILNLLDIWGLGNRPMFRTLKELFWRPGYMVRDYLGGHRQFYFPPFKLLAVTVVLFISVSFLVVRLLRLVGGDAADISGLIDMTISSNIVDLLERIKPTGFLKAIIDDLLVFFNFLSRNLLYDWLFVAVFMVLCIWIAFRRVSKYNFVETYIFFIFVLSQWTIYKAVEWLGTGLCRAVETASLSNAASQPVALVFLVSVFSLIAGLVSTAYTFFGIYLFLADFKQFYGQSWESTLTRLGTSVLMGIWFLTMLITFAAVISPTVSEYRPNLILLIVAIIVVPLAFIFANGYMTKNESHVNRIVKGVTKGLMLSVISTFSFNLFLIENNYTLLSAIAIEVAYCALATGLSILPIILYKKLRRTWVAFLPVPLVVALLAWVYYIY